jgi:hypothetical protein
MENSMQPTFLQELKSVVEGIVNIKSVIDEALTKQEKKRKKYAAFAKKAAKRGKNFSPDLKEPEKGTENKTATKKLKRGHLKSVPEGHHVDKKTHKVIHSTGKSGNTKFANATTFRSTRSDAHLHTDADCNQGLRGRTPADMYAKHASAEELKKHPCKKSYPIFPTAGDRARIAGSARMAAEYKDPTVISRIKAAGEKVGMHIHGNLWNERPECKEYNRTGKLPTGWTKKDCEPHGEGGADEWLRKFRAHKSKDGKLKHAPTMRNRTHYGAGKLPKKHMDDHEYAKSGGHWGEKAVQFGRNLAGHEKSGKVGHHISGSKWARQKLKSTGIKHSHEVGHATTGEPKGPGTQVKKSHKYAEPEHKGTPSAIRSALRAKKKKK